MKIFTYLFLLIFTSTIYAQSVKHITVKDGLPQSFVSGIEQDKQGFIWISTRNGLARFDGNEFKVFQHIPKDNTSLSSNIINKIGLLNGNTLWINYESGEVDLLNTLSESIEHLYNNDTLIKNKISTNDKTFLISKNREFWTYSTPEKLTKFSLNSEINDKIDFYFKNDTIRSLFEDKNNDMWVLTQQSLKKYNRQSNSFCEIKIPYKLSYNDDNYFGYDVPKIYEGLDKIMIWSDVNFIYEFNPSNEQFKKSLLPVTLNRSLVNYSYNPVTNDLCFLIDKNLYVYGDDIEFKKQLPLTSKEKIKIFSIDRSGLIWIAIDTDGVYQIDYSYNFIDFDYEINFVVDIFKKYYKISSNDVENILIKNDFVLPISYYLRSYVDDNNNWLALNRSIFCYNFKEKTYEEYPKLPDNINRNEFDPIVGISLLNSSSPIVITQAGKIYSYTKKVKNWQKIENQLPEKISPKNMLVIDNFLWVTTSSNGLFYFNLSTKKWFKVNDEKLPVANLISLAKDKSDKDILWIASYSGLIRFNTKNFDSRIFSKKQGLPDNTIYSILTDEEGYLWLGTNSGLCRFNTLDFTQKTFSLEHGTPILEYNRYHNLQLSDGNFAFGGTKKGVFFNPLTIRKDTYAPQTVVTKIEVNNEAISLETPNESITELKLNYKENNLTLGYSALQFNQPQDIKYRYRLNGYDLENQWKEVDDRREAIYTKIPPGNYLFEVNSSNTSGIWSNYIKQVKIKISPPWWSSWWSWIIYFLVFVLIIVFFIRYQVKQKILATSIQLKQKEALRLQELDEIKNKFFSDITHELRTPLSLILGPAEHLKKSINNQKDIKLLNIISQNGKNLLELTNQLLDFSKVQAGVLKPTYSKGDLKKTINHSIAAFSEELKQKDIKIYEENSISGYYSYSREFIERIMYNLLSNAIKYNRKGGEIFVSVNETKTGVLIEVRDTGIGIDKDHLDKIFKRYYREKSVESIEAGSGIGLSLVEELIKLQKGSITVTSQKEAPSGTAFKIYLPYKKIQPGYNNQSITANTSNLTIVLAEDNKNLRDFICASFGNKYKVFAVANAEEALDLSLKIIPDLILTDIMMGEMNGIKLCENIKSNVLTAHIPVILLTAKAGIENKLEGLSVGADEYMYKPFNVEELLLKVKNILDRSAKQRAFMFEELHTLKKPIKTVDNETIDPFLSKIFSIIDVHIDDETFNVNELAKSLGMSRTSLHRKMKAITNTTPTEIIKLRRIKHAVKLFNNNISVSEVSYKSGFSSPSYFSKCFKEIYDMTPSQYLQTQV